MEIDSRDLNNPHDQPLNPPPSASANPVRTANGDPVGWLSDVSFDSDGERLHFSVELFSAPLIAEVRHHGVLIAERHRRNRLAAWIATAPIAILVIGGGVWLIAQRGRAGATADVRHAAAALQRTSANLAESASDAATTARVKTAFALSKRVSAMDVAVDTKGAVATLTGTVPSSDVKDLAGQIAADTTGVREVRNFLTVDTSKVKS